MADYRIRDVYPSMEKDMDDIRQLLSDNDLTLDSFVEKTVGIYDENNLVATGSVSGNTLRSICVSPSYRGTSVINKLMTYLIDYQYQRGKHHIFVYTKPDSAGSFRYFGFYPLVKTDKVALLDSQMNGVETFLSHVKADMEDGAVVGSIVMNANPFTKGHKYLIDQALRDCDHLYVFVVWEQKSLFPNEVRYRLIDEGLRDYGNVHLVKGEDYIISGATFPTYFLKDGDKVIEEHVALDLTIYGDIIAPYLNISKRYVGQETICQTTAQYNTAMKRILTEKGLEVIEIPRLEADGKQISASHVREYIKNDQWKKIQAIVPRATYDYIRSHEGEVVINRIKNSSTRH